MTVKALKTRLVLVLSLCLATASASATGGLTCTIDDANVDFTLFAATNREHGTIVNVTGSTLRLKSKALMTVAPGFAKELQIAQDNIMQQWFLERELRLAVAVDNEHGELLLAVIGQAKGSNYSGRYILTVSNAGNSRTVKGRIKGCGTDG